MFGSVYPYNMEKEVFIRCKEYPCYDGSEITFRKSFVLADRFEVYKQRIDRSDFFGETNHTFVIKGERSEERVFVHLLYEHQYSMVTRVRFHRHKSWERELSSLLVHALVDYLKRKNFEFSPTALQKYRK